MTQNIHPAIDSDNETVQNMPEKFTEGTVLQYNGKQWTVREVRESPVARSDCGYKYKIEGRDAVTFISHGELQWIAVHESLRWL